MEDAKKKGKKWERKIENNLENREIKVKQSRYRPGVAQRVPGS